MNPQNTFVSSAKANRIIRDIKRSAITAQGSAKYCILTWNHRTCKAGKFSFRDSLELAVSFAREYCGYLEDNQAQVSETGTYPVKVVYRATNRNGKVVGAEV